VPARLEDYTLPLRWSRFPAGGAIDVVTAGRQDATYAASLSAMDWDAFYAKGGGPFLDALREDMKAGYDYALVDSGPGFGDVADICTTHLPDVLVDCFTLAEKAVDGAAKAAAAARRGRRPIRVLPVPMKIDGADAERVDAGRVAARDRFAGLPDGLTDDQRAAYWRHVEVPYRSAYSYEEILAAFGDLSAQPGSLLAAYEQIAWYLTDGEVRALPIVQEPLRRITADRFLRPTTVRIARVFLRRQPEQLVWADWITEVLKAAGVVVEAPDSPRHAASTHELMIIADGRSAREAARRPIDTTSGRAPLGVYIDRVPVTPAFAEGNSVVLDGLTEPEAVAQLLHLIGHTERPPRPIGERRYPGRPPVLVGVPPVTAEFTGRGELLERVYDKLRTTSEVTPRQHAPVALHGVGGVGKTQTVLAFIHHFGGVYDLVCWFRGDDLDGDMSQLARALGLVPGEHPGETVRAVLAALRKGKPHRRWLMVFDDVLDYDQIGPYLPQGEGKVLITTRNRAWNDRVIAVPVEVFDRVESIIHLERAVGGLSRGDADALAQAVGDLPAAVAAAGTLLTRTGIPAEQLRRQLDEQGPSVLGVEHIWDESLVLLRDSAGGAYRLLQLFSVLGSEIALKLVYSEEMAAALRPYDKSVVDRYTVGAVVQQNHRFGLLTLDHTGDRLGLHPLLQQVIRGRMSPAELHETRHHAHLVLAGLRHDRDAGNPATWPLFAILWPHLEVSRAADCHDEKVRALLIERVRYLRHHDAFDEGLALARATDALWSSFQETFAEDDERHAVRRQVLHLRYNVGKILRDLGRFTDAYRLDREVRREQVALLGPLDRHSLMTSNALAADLRALGRYAQALELDIATYAAWADRFGVDNDETLTARNCLATSYRLAGDHRSALEHDRAVEERPRSDDEPHTAVLRATAQVGRDLRDAGDYQASVDRLQRVVRGYTEIFGGSSRVVLEASIDLARSLRAAGFPDQACPLLEDAYERLNDSLGPANPATLACRHSWSLTLLAVGQIERARAELHGVRDAYAAWLGERHPHTGVAVAGLAMVARAAGDADTALRHAETADRDLTEVLGERHPYTLAAAMNLAVLRAERGERAEALALMRAVLERMREVLSPDHPDTMRAEANVALTTDADETAVMIRLARRITVSHPTVAALRGRRLLHRLPDPY